MKIFTSSVRRMLQTMALVLAGTLPLTQPLAQEGKQQSGIGTATVGPPRPGLREGEKRPPEPTAEELKRLEKHVEEETFLPGPPLPEVKPPDPGPPGPETVPKDICPHSSRSS